MPSGEFPFTKFLIPEVGPEQHTNIKDREETEVTNDGDDETEIPCSYCRCGKILHSFAAVNSLIMSNHALTYFQCWIKQNDLASLDTVYPAKSALPQNT